MKKFFMAILMVWATAFPVAAKGIEIVNENLYQQLLNKTATSNEDIELYRQIFAAQKDSDFKTAITLTGRLKSKALLGHVLAEKYLHKDYKSTYEELQAWLKKYSYLPQYERIKAVAVTKAPGYKPQPAKPEPKKIIAHYDWYKDSYFQLKPKDRQYVRQKMDEFVVAVRRSHLNKAASVLQDKRLRLLLPASRYDGMAATLAAAYFLEGDNLSALKWSQNAVKRSRDATAAWFGGLAGWKEKDYKLSADYFGHLGNLKNNDESLIAAGAYWAYRANLKLNQPKTANAYLKKAAAKKNTFYGLLAGYQLAGQLKYDWQPQSHFNNLADRRYQQDLLALPVLRRSLLLLKAGQNNLAEAELKKNYRKLSRRQRELLLFVSEQYGLANLSYIIASNLKSPRQGRHYDNFMYPLPEWQPEGGWKENPSWIWALIRQESLFSPVARSHAGACGLMQVMPATAAQMTDDKSLQKNWRPLFEPETNMRIGQSYVTYLRNCDYIGDNLFFLAAAYNGGHHNLKKWVEKIDYNEDPLLFVEQIPWRETRLYVKKVVANYWLYNSRIGIESRSLQQLSAGEWPLLDRY